MNPRSLALAGVMVRDWISGLDAHYHVYSVTRYQDHWGYAELQDQIFAMAVQLHVEPTYMQVFILHNDWSKSKTDTLLTQHQKD